MDKDDARQPALIAGLSEQHVRDLMLRGLVPQMLAIEKQMRMLYRQAVRRVWIGRALVLVNVTVMTSDLAMYGKSWVWVLALFPGWAAWYAFRNAEEWATDLAPMRWALRDIAEKIKQAEGIANESRA